MSKFRHIRNTVSVNRLTIDDLNEREVQELKRIGRLAFRHEGKFYNCYYALPNSMEKALFIGCVPFAAIRDDRLMQERFIELMRDVLNKVMSEKLGRPIEWKINDITDVSKKGK